MERTLLLDHLTFKLQRELPSGSTSVDSFVNFYFFYFYFQRSTFVGSAWSFVFFIPATTANDVRLKSIISHQGYTFCLYFQDDVINPPEPTNDVIMPSLPDEFLQKLGLSPNSTESKRLAFISMFCFHIIQLSKWSIE